MLGIRKSSLYQATYIYLGLPLFIFILSWLNFGIAVIFSLLYLVAFAKIYSYNKTEDNNFHISQKIIIFASVVALFWCFFAGIGYFYYQSWDYHFRNAVFRDLINYTWPVMYDKADTPMVYYMGFWLFPAALTKLTAFFSHDPILVFFIGNIYLYLYAVFGVTLIFLHLTVALKINSIKKLLIALTIFIFFSGLDIVGYLFFQIMPQPFQYHLDWWATFMQYSSFSTGLFWVFNQFIMASLTILLVYNQKAVFCFGFIIPLVLFLAPYPTAGIGVLMIAYAGYRFYQLSDKKPFIIKECFSVPNLIGVFWILPLVVLYFITNS